MILVVILWGFGFGLKLEESKCPTCKVKEKFFDEKHIHGDDQYYSQDTLAQLAANGIDISHLKDIESHADPPTVI